MSEPHFDAEAAGVIAAWRAAGDRIVFTNGVFDLLHRGHVEALAGAKAFGQRLVVGGPAGRSVINHPDPDLAERRHALDRTRRSSVDLVVCFGEDTPERVIRDVAPDVLVKGGDWALDEIVGKQFVESRGGRVARITVREGWSTTRILERIAAGKGALDPESAASRRRECRRRT
jgi:D-beta-D-heptose 7-phosphate kinase/D-beta-D-heptose 1-phosphate adenosyltransferase